MKCRTEATPTKPAMVYMVLLYRKGLNEKTGKLYNIVCNNLGSIVPGGIMVINLEMVKVLASIRV